MPPEPDSSGDNERLLDRLITSYLDAADAGPPPDRQELLARHPELAPALAEFFADYDRLDQAAAPLRGAAVAARRAGPPEQTPTDATARASPPPPGRVPYFGDYELLAEIGQGGCGIVYKARQVSLNRIVALKMILAGRLASAAERQRFRNEAEAVANLDHPHIVPLFEVGEHQGQHYFSMRHLGGGSLGQSVSKGRWPEPGKEGTRRAARLVATVARAVHHAHQRGILHRDLKPANILLDDQGQPHVADFGLAKRVEANSDLTQSGAILGTPSYMAPEQTSGKRAAVTTATDVYGLGAILYVLLTGRPPFQAETVLDTLLLVKARPPEPPSRLNPRVDHDLETICLKCLEKEPASRYGSAEALAEDLEHWLKGEPIRARPIGLAAQFGRWCRRNPLVASLAAAVALLLGASMVGLLVSNVLIRREQEQTQAEKERTEAQFQKRMAAVDSYFTRVSESPELRAHGLEKLRRDLLGDAKAFYEQFAQEAGGSATVQAERGKVHGKLAKVLAEMGETREAIDHGQQARAIFEELARTWPGEPTHRHNLGSILLDLGSFSSQRKEMAQAEQVLDEALPIYQRLVEEHGEALAYQEGLGRALHDLAVVYLETGRGDQAREYLERSLGLLRSLIERQPDQIAARYLTVGAHYNLGRAHRDRREFELAESSYGRAVSLLKELAQERPNVPLYRRRLGDCYADLGYLYHTWRKGDPALKAYEESVRIKEELVNDHPRVMVYRQGLASVVHDLGMLCMEFSRLEQGRASLERSLQLYEALAKTQENEPEFRYRLAMVNYNLGRLHRQTRAFEAAEARYQRTLGLLRALAVEQPADPSFRLRLGGTLSELGALYAEAGQWDRAEATYAEAVVINEQLARDYPKNLAHTVQCAKNYNDLGILARRADRFEEAQADFERALALFQPLLERESHPGEIHHQVANTLANFADLCLVSGRAEEARALFETALPIREKLARAHPKLPPVQESYHNARLLVAATRARLGEPEEAVAETETIVKSAPALPQVLYNASCTYALASAAARLGRLPEKERSALAGRYADRGMELLRQATAAGYGDVGNMKKDIDLDALRARPDFQELMRQLEAKRPAGGR